MLNNVDTQKAFIATLKLSRFPEEVVGFCADLPEMEIGASSLSFIANYLTTTLLPYIPEAVGKEPAKKLDENENLIREVLWYILSKFAPSEALSINGQAVAKNFQPEMERFPSDTTVLATVCMEIVKRKLFTADVIWGALKVLPFFKKAVVVKFLPMLKSLLREYQNAFDERVTIQVYFECFSTVCIIAGRAQETEQVADLASLLIHFLTTPEFSKRIYVIWAGIYAARNVPLFAEALHEKKMIIFETLKHNFIEPSRELRRTTATLLGLIFKGDDSGLFQLFEQCLEMPFTFVETRNYAGVLDKLWRGYKFNKIDCDKVMFWEAVPLFLLGLYHDKFSPFWKIIRATLTQFARENFEAVWKVYFEVIQEHTKEIDENTELNKSAIEEEMEEETELEDEFKEEPEMDVEEPAGSRKRNPRGKGESAKDNGAEDEDDKTGETTESRLKRKRPDLKKGEQRAKRMHVTLDKKAIKSLEIRKQRHADLIMLETEFRTTLKSEESGRDFIAQRKERMNVEAFYTIEQSYEHQSATEIFDYDELIWQGLQDVSAKVEQKNSEVVPFFMSFFFARYIRVFTILGPSELPFSMYQELPYYTAAQKGTEEVCISKKAAKKKMLCFLHLFSSFTKPKAMTQSAVMFDIFTQLLGQNDPEVQRVALDCLMTWKPESVYPYRKHLANLLSISSFSNEIAMFQPSDPHVVQVKDRNEVTRWLVKVLFPYINKQYTNHRQIGQMRKRIMKYFSMFSDEDRHFVFQRLLLPYSRLTSSGATTSLPSGASGDGAGEERTLTAHYVYFNVLEKFITSLKHVSRPFMHTLVHLVLLGLNHALCEEKSHRKLGDVERAAHLQEFRKAQETHTICINLLVQLLSYHSKWEGWDDDLESNEHNELTVLGLYPLKEQLFHPIAEKCTSLISTLFSVCKSLFTSFSADTNELPTFQLLELLITIASSDHLRRYVLENTALSNGLISFVNSTTCPEKVSQYSLKFISILLNAVNKDSTAKQLIKSNVTRIIDGIKVRLNAPQLEEKTAREVRSAQRTLFHILSKVSEYVESPEQAQDFVRLLLRFLKMSPASKTVVNLLHAYGNMIALITSLDEVLTQFFGLFMVLKGRTERLALVGAFERTAAREKELGLNYSLELVTPLIKDLNSYSKNSLEERIDQQKCERGFNTFNKLVHDKEVIYGSVLDDSDKQKSTELGKAKITLNGINILPVIYTLFFGLSSEEKIVRDECLYCLQKFVRRVAEKYPIKTKEEFTAAMRHSFFNIEQNKAANMLKPRRNKESPPAAEQPGAEMQYVIVNFMYNTVSKNLKQGFETKAENMSLTILGEIARAFPAAYPDLYLLTQRTEEEKEEALKKKDKDNLAEGSKLVQEPDDYGFFTDVTSVFVSKRIEAFKKLNNFVKSRQLQEQTVQSIFLPYAIRIFGATKEYNQGMVEVLIDVVGSFHGLMTWEHYLASLKRITKLLHREKNVKSTIRLICGIVDNFHFEIEKDDVAPLTADDVMLFETIPKFKNVSKKAGKGTSKWDRVAEEERELLREDFGTGDDAPTEEQTEKAKDDHDEERDGEENDKESVKEDEKIYSDDEEDNEGKIVEKQDNLKLSTVRRAVLGYFLPLLQKLLDNDNFTRPVVALAICKLLKLLPYEETELFLTQMILSLGNTLCERLEEIRSQVRSTLCKICVMLGPQSFKSIIVTLCDNLTRGYQLHILTYTINAILKAVSETFEPGWIDEAISTIVPLLMEDVIGQTAEQKTVAEIANTFKEAKVNKVNSTFGLLAQLCSFGSVADGLCGAGKLLRPLIMHVKEAPSLEVVEKLQSIFKSIRNGFLHNKSVTTENLAPFCYLIVNGNLAVRKKVQISEFQQDEEDESADSDSDSDNDSDNDNEALPGEGENNAESANEAPTTASDKAQEDADAQRSRQRRKRIVRTWQTASERARDRMLLPAAPSRYGVAPVVQRSSNAYVLSEFGASLMLGALKSPKLFTNDLASCQYLEPFVYLFSKCLGERHDGVVQYALYCLIRLFQYDLPSLVTLRRIIAERTIKVIKHTEDANAQLHNAALSVIVVCLRFVPSAALLQQVHTSTSTSATPDGESGEPSTMELEEGDAEKDKDKGDEPMAVEPPSEEGHLEEDQSSGYKRWLKQASLEYLINRCKVEIEHVSNRNMTYLLIQTFLKLKVITLSIYDLMTRVIETAIRSQAEDVRQECSKLYAYFVINYPSGEKRRLQQIQFLVKNLRFEYPNGRVSVLRTIKRLAEKMPPEALSTYAEMVFLGVLNAVLNDEEPDVRAEAAKVIGVLLDRVPGPNYTTICNFTFTWLDDVKTVPSGLLLARIAMKDTPEKYTSFVPTLIPALIDQLKKSLPEYMTEFTKTQEELEAATANYQLDETAEPEPDDIQSDVENDDGDDDENDNEADVEKLIDAENPDEESKSYDDEDEEQTGQATKPEEGEEIETEQDNIQESDDENMDEEHNAETEDEDENENEEKDNENEEENEDGENKDNKESFIKKIKKVDKSPFIKWNLTYSCLITLEELFTKYPRYLGCESMSELYLILGDLLYHRHLWVQTAVARIYGMLFSVCDANKIAGVLNTQAHHSKQQHEEKQNAVLKYLSNPNALFRILKAMCYQFGTPLLNQALATQVLKNLLYFTKVFCKCPDVVPQALKYKYGQDDTTAKEGESQQAPSGAGRKKAVSAKYSVLQWLVNRLLSIGKKGTPVFRSSLLKFCAAFFTIVPQKISSLFLPDIFVFVYRASEKFNTDKDERRLANEVLATLRSHTDHSKFLEVSRKVREELETMRAKRSRSAKIAKVSNPVKLQKEKLKQRRQHEKARERKKAERKENSLATRHSIFAGKLNLDPI